MVFSSHLFLFYFLPLVLIFYFGGPVRWRHLSLTLLSYVFYAWANPLFVILMFISTAIDYSCGRMMVHGAGEGDAWGQLDPKQPRTGRQKLALYLSLCSNLSLLGFFKYFNFGIDTWNALSGALGLSGLDWALRITLPLGISFYTFQSMSYSIDIYRGDARAIRNPIDFACYVAMFPQLVAGPIIRFSEVSEQLRNRTHTLEKFSRGIAFLVLGLSKKVLLANPCGKVADTVFNAGSLQWWDAWIGTFSYSFQIYFDFSGYSDMAIGLGLMLGFVFPKNFDSPYHSRSITEFWRRWHISLSSWLRDYLYIPLGGNRKGEGRTYVNLMLVMVLGGLWHGASWKFVIWGLIHGMMLAWERKRGKSSMYSRWPVAVQVGLTYVLVCFAWVFFRADDLSHALSFLCAMAGWSDPLPTAALIDGLLFKPYYLGMLLISAVVIWRGPQSWTFSRTINGPKALLLLLLFLLCVAVLTTQSFNPFIYFIF